MPYSSHVLDVKLKNTKPVQMAHSPNITFANIYSQLTLSCFWRKEILYVYSISYHDLLCVCNSTRQNSKIQGEPPSLVSQLTTSGRGGLMETTAPAHVRQATWTLVSGG